MVPYTVYEFAVVVSYRATALPHAVVPHAAVEHAVALVEHAKTLAFAVVRLPTVNGATAADGFYLIRVYRARGKHDNRHRAYQD